MKGIRLLHISFQQSGRQAHLGTVRKLVDTVFLHDQIDVLDQINRNDGTGQCDHKILRTAKMQTVIKQLQIPCLLYGLWIGNNVDKGHENGNAQ